MDAGNLVSDGSDVSCTSLDAAHISIRAIKKTVELTVGIDSAGTAMRVHTRVLILIVVEPDCIGLGACQNRSLGCCNLGVDGINTAALLLSKGIESRHELLEVDAACRSLLNLRESHVDICRRELLIDELGVLSHLGETFAVHGGLAGAAVVIESLLELFLRDSSCCFNHCVCVSV